jgi:proteasome lid subunit RPN8/RPN11
MGVKKRRKRRMREAGEARADVKRGSDGLIEVRYDDEVWRGIVAHCQSVPDREVGGVLLGELRGEAGRVVLWVEGFVPALRASAGAGHVTFTGEAWAEIHRQIDEKHAGARIVGWYHSHPGFGVFLSDMDKFICRNFFEQPHMTALVVDPLSGDAGSFVWHAGELERVDAPEVLPMSRATGVSAADRAMEAAVMVLCMIVVGSFVYAWLSWSGN